MEIEEYRRMAAVEDRMWYYRALHRHIERTLLGGLPPAVMQRPEILDAGCGTGGLIRRLQTRHPAWRWMGVDVEPIACAYARERAVGATIVEGSVETLPCAEAQFDAVVSADVLYHVDDDSRALREFARVLRPGGVLIVNVPAHPWLWSYHDVAVHGRRRYTRGELDAKILRAGLRLERSTHWNFLPLPLVWVRRKLLPPPRRGSDVQLFPSPVEAMFNGAMAAERALLRVAGRLPAGSSLLAVARRT